jgi:DNA ligase-1
VVTVVDVADGDSVEMQGSGAKPYVLRNVGGVYSCTCPAWRNQSVAIERRTCKHLRRLRGDAAEEARLGGPIPAKVPRASRPGEEGDATSGDEPGPPLLLAETWDSAADLTGWWMSEKLDGVRAYWDGRQFLSRLGNLYHAPAWFVDRLPPEPLDGELWLARRTFQRTVSIVRRQDQSGDWKALRFVVFDAPAMDTEFEARIRSVNDCIAERQPPYAVAHEHRLCTGIDHLRAELSRVESLGGEGLMLRQPRSRYAVGRSSTLLKVKSFRDAEAVVVSHQPGAGRHKGRLGALLVRMSDGTTFSIGTGFSDAERASPPPAGSTVTFRYQELSDGGVPRFPSYVGVRDDVVIAAPLDPPPADSTVRAKPPAAVQPDARPASGSARYFEFVGGSSRKFWEIGISGNDVTVRFGRIGSAGQTRVKTFADASAAAEHCAVLIAEKTRDGYEEK